MSTMDNPGELRRRGIELLVRELGYADAMRFLQQFGTGRGDYTAEREGLLKQRGMSDAEMLEEADRLAREEQKRRRAAG